MGFPGRTPLPSDLGFCWLCVTFCTLLVWFMLEVFYFRCCVFYAVFLFTIEVLFVGLFRVFCVFRCLVLSCSFCVLVWFRR